MFIKRLAGRFIRFVQGVRLYRKLAAPLGRGIKITEADEDDLRAVHQWFNPGRETKVLHNPNVTNFVAKKGKKIIGFVQLVSYPNNPLYPGWWRFSLTVRPLYRGMGIGRRLADAVTEKARGYGAKTLSLIVREDNKRAIRLDEKLGFYKDAGLELEKKLVEEAIKTGRRRIIMTKELLGLKGTDTYFLRYP